MVRFFHNYLLLIIVFITGAAILVIEVTATRMLSPYFGNTIFTVSSVITVILLALSLGYYFGGRLADKHASEKLFFQIIAFSGVSVLVLQLLNSMFLPVVSTQFTMQYGPLVASLLLFLLPGFLLGLLSPLVVTLQKKRLEKQGIGQVTGEVFFWSTLGSIIGSLSTGFFLIPQFGISQIIVGTGLVLLTIGLIGMNAAIEKHFSGRRLLLMLLMLPVAQFGLVSLTEASHDYKTIYAKDGVYDNIFIYDDNSSGSKIRYLKQGNDASSAMYIDSPELVYDYTKYSGIYKLVNPDIKNALVIGGGAYSVPKALLRDDSDVVVDVAEIEPSMFEVGKKYFKIPDDARLQNHVEDGRRFLQESDKRYDVIFLDAFHFSIPPQFATQEFFKLSKEKLAPKGVIVMNLIGKLSQETPSFILSEVKTFQSVYPNSYVFGVYSAKESYLQNVILVGYNAETPLDFANTTNPFLQTIKEKQVDVKRFNVDTARLFTDDYAPTEYYIMRSFL